MRLTAGQVKQLLELAVHPTCGFTRTSHRSPRVLKDGTLGAPFDGPRVLASVLYFLVTPERRMGLHRVRSDQMYHHYLGDPLEVLMLHPDGRGERVTIGGDLLAGMRPQLLIPGGTWHVSRVRPGGEYALLGTTEWPGFEPADLELGDPQKLARDYPAFAEMLRAFIG